MSRNERIFEEMFISPWHEGFSHVLVAADAGFTADDGEDYLGQIALASYHDGVGEDPSERGSTLLLSVPEIRCIADMLNRAADALDPDRAQDLAPGQIPWWKVVAWYFKWTPLVGDRVMSGGRGVRELGTIVGIAGDQITVAWDSGAVADTTEDDIDRVFQARLERRPTT